MSKIKMEIEEIAGGVSGSVVVKGLGLMAFVFCDDDASAYALLAEYLMVQGKMNILQGCEPTLGV